MPYQPNYKYIPPIELHFLTPFYDLACTLIGLGKKFRNKILNKINLENAKTVADIGCGTGFFVSIAAEKYPNIKWITLDPDKKALSIAQRRFSKLNLKNTEIFECFAEALPIENESIDIATSTLAFHHMPNESKRLAIQEIFRVLKPNGKFIITDFGSSNKRWLKYLLFFEKFEYLEGHFQGLIPKLLTENGFLIEKDEYTRWPAIRTITATKNA